MLVGAMSVRGRHAQLRRRGHRIWPSAVVAWRVGARHRRPIGRVDDGVVRMGPWEGPAVLAALNLPLKALEDMQVVLQRAGRLDHDIKEVDGPPEQVAQHIFVYQGT